MQQNVAIKHCLPYNNTQQKVSLIILDINLISIWYHDRVCINKFCKRETFSAVKFSKSTPVGPQVQWRFDCILVQIKGRRREATFCSHQAGGYKRTGIKCIRKGRQSYLLLFEQPDGGLPKLLSWGELRCETFRCVAIEEAIFHSCSAMCDFVTGDPLLTLRVSTIYIWDDTDASDELQLHPGV